MLILVVEDEPKIRDILTAYLEHEGWKVDVTGDGHEAVQKFDYHQHDLILLDLMIEGLSGEEVCKRIREKSNVPIMMVTSKSRKSDTIKGLDLGADDYIVKPFSPKEVVARIRALHRRVSDLKQDKADVKKVSFNNGHLKIDYERREAFVGGQSAGLTETEFRLLAVMVDKPKKAFTRSDLYYQVLGYRFQGEGRTRTMDMHVRNLRKKLKETKEQPSYIVTRIGVGYAFDGVQDDVQ